MYYYLLHTVGIAIRLVNDSSYYGGRVEVNYNGEWGTVCQNGWYSTNTGVVCKQLGLGSYGSSYYNAHFGQGSGPIWLDSVTCTYSESTLAECGHIGINVTGRCDHDQDVGVICHGRGTYVAVYVDTLRLTATFVFDFR